MCARPLILLVQLPIPPAGHEPVRGNVPLAAGYLKLLARRRGLEALYDIETDKVIAVYKSVYPGASPSQLMIQMGTDTSMGVRSALLAERKADLRKAPVYMFRFDWPSPCFDGKFGSTHGLEIPFVTDNISEMQVMTHDLPEAHALYRKLGYRDIPAFNSDPYCHFWFGKEL